MADPSKLRRDCVGCIIRGYNFCGNYAHPNQNTRCQAEPFKKNWCRVTVASFAKQCEDKKLNPKWSRKYKTPPKGGVEDKVCSSSIDLEYSDKSIVPKVKAHSVKKGSICLITINNFSGVTHNVQIVEPDHEGESEDKKKKEVPEEKLLRLFKLDNTDELQWRTIKNMEAAQKVEQGGDDDHHHEAAKKFDVISGTGKGIYVINLSDDDAATFDTKIVRTAAARVYVGMVSVLTLALLL